VNGLAVAVGALRGPVWLAGLLLQAASSTVTAAAIRIVIFIVQSPYRRA
jgi:hypothetical protein